MRRVVVARWGYDTGEVVLSLFEGDPWVRVQEQSIVFSVIPSYDSVGFSALDDSSFQVCYAEGNSFTTGTRAYYVERVSVSSTTGFTRGPRHLLTSGPTSTAVLPVYMPYWIAMDNGGEGRMGGNGVRSTDGRYLITLGRSAAAPSVYWLDVYSLTDDGETAFLARHSWPHHGTFLALTGSTFMTWDWTTADTSVIRVNDDGSLDTLATGTMPRDPDVGAYFPSGVFWLPAADRVIGVFPNYNNTRSFGMRAADPTDLVFGDAALIYTGSDYSYEPYVNPWVVESTMPGRGLMGAAKYLGDPTITDGDARRMVVPFDIDGTAITYGVPTFVGPTLPADWPNFQFGEPTVVAPQMVTWAHELGSYPVDNDFYVGKIGQGGADEDASKLTSAIHHYNLIDVLSLSTDSEINSTASGVRVHFQTAR